MQKWLDHEITGLLLGLLAPVFAFWLYVFLQYPELSMMDVFSSFMRRKVHTHVISLAVIANLLIFFCSLWLHKEKTARGILGTTIGYAVLVFILKLF